MEQPGSIELRIGPDGLYRAAVALLWLLALLNILCYAQVLAMPWLALAFLLLALLNPWSGNPDGAGRHVHIFRDGTFISEQQRGRWQGGCWSSRWAAILHIEPGPGTAPAERILVCASRNSSADYRHLLVWNRHPPSGTRSGILGIQSSSGART